MVSRWPAAGLEEGEKEASKTGGRLPLGGARQTDPSDDVQIAHLDLLDDLAEGRTVSDTVLPGDPHLLRALTLRRGSIGGRRRGRGRDGEVRRKHEWAAARA